MNHEAVSAVFFEESYIVPADQTARSLFSRLPHGRDYAEQLIECLATGYLVAVIESVCIREVQQLTDADAEVVVGRSIRIDHRGPIPPGSPLRLRGWVERLSDHSVTFRVRAHDAHEVVCEAVVTLVATSRQAIESRITAKAAALRKPNPLSYAGWRAWECAASPGAARPDQVAAFPAPTAAAASDRAEAGSSRRSGPPCTSTPRRRCRRRGPGSARSRCGPTVTAAGCGRCRWCSWGGASAMTPWGGSRAQGSLGLS